MAEEQIHWTNEEIYREVIRDIIRRISEEAASEVTLKNFKEAFAKQDTTDFQDLLVEMQLSSLYYLMLWLDGAVGPSIWPGLQLINAQTGEPLSSDYGMELAGVIHETLYID